MYSNARGIKSKVNSLKQILINNPCEIIALCETHLNQNENVPQYRQAGLTRKDKDGGVIGFLINNKIVKSCFVEPQTNHRILEILTIRLELKQNKTIIICIYYGKQETKQLSKKQREILIIYYSTFQSTYKVIPLITWRF